MSDQRELLEQRLRSRSTKEALILVLDEMDELDSSQQEILYRYTRLDGS